MTYIPCYVSSVFSNHILNTYTLVWKPFEFCYAMKIKCVFWKQDALAEQTTVLQRDIGSSYKTDEMKPPHCQLSQSLCEVSSDEESWTTSKDLTASVVEDSEDEKSWTTRKDLAACVVKDSEDEMSWTASKDLEACVVEDFEDEVEVVSIRRTRRRLMRN